MKNIYKKINWILLLSLLVGFSSCDDLADTEETPFAPYV